MQILYVWIENYRNIRNQGFNFSSEFEISFEPINLELRITKDPNYITNLFGSQFSNITAIVGENGTGKSNLLKFKSIGFYLVCINNECLLVIEDEKYERIIISIDEIGVSKFRLSHDLASKQLNEVLFIKYANYFEANVVSGINNNTQFPDSYHKTFDFWNQSTDSVLANNYFTNSLEEKNILNKYRLYETFIQADFLFRGLHLPFKTPEKLIVSFSLGEEVNGLYKNLKTVKGQEKELLDKLLNFLEVSLKELHEEITNTKNTPARNSKIKEMTISQLMWSALLNFINTYPPQSDPSVIDALYGFKHNWDNTSIIKWFDEFFNNRIIEYHIEENYIGSKHEHELRAWKNAVNMVSAIKKLLVNSSIQIAYEEYDYIRRLNNEVVNPYNCRIHIDITEKENYESFAKAFFANYKAIIWAHRMDSRGFLDYEWRGLSTGEKNYLSLFSRINSLNFNIKAMLSPKWQPSRLVKHIVLVIDEGEIGMHPQWQKSYINTLIKSLPEIFKETLVETFQLILATHSPFVLSDLPTSNIIFLTKDKNGNSQVIKNPLQEKKPTFASNIHTLFSDGFFIEGGTNWGLCKGENK